VDDNEGICILIARMLSNMGFKSINIANSAKQAYDIFGTVLAESDREPIIFLDLRLPDVPGEKVARKIHEILPSAKLIVVTAEDSSKIRSVLASVISEIGEERKKKGMNGDLK